MSTQKDFYGFIPKPRWYKYQLKAIQQKLGKKCSVYITGDGLLTFDSSLPHRDRNEAFIAAKAASITLPVLYHGMSNITALLWNGKVVHKF